MHGSKSSLGQIWIQTYLLVLGAIFFAWADLRWTWRRQKAQAKDTPRVIEVSVNSAGR